MLYDSTMISPLGPTYKLPSNISTMGLLNSDTGEGEEVSYQKVPYQGFLSIIIIKLPDEIWWNVDQTLQHIEIYFIQWFVYYYGLEFLTQIPNNSAIGDQSWMLYQSTS